MYSINPLAAARYRERHSVARSKSDQADAVTLANILCVDAHLHRRLPADSELSQAIAVLARAHQDATWRRIKAHNELRSMLREFFPTFLATFTQRFALGMASPEARAVLAIAPTPPPAAKLTVSRIATALRRVGRSRNIEQTATDIRTDLRTPQLRISAARRGREPSRPPISFQSGRCGTAKRQLRHLNRGSLWSGS
ncbi:MAG: hypothetical protein QOG14_2089, partial [Mycobacterium sp.]|nr:hypothetical protein [Mycobacterium sp.]